MIEQTFYRKQGRKYIPVGGSWEVQFFPADGLFLVYSGPGRKGYTQICELSDLESLPAVTIGAVHQVIQECVDTISRREKAPMALMMWQQELVLEIARRLKS